MSLVSKKIVPETKLEYPCLMALKTDPDLVVLFVSERVGVAVHSQDPTEIGHRCTQWEPSLFTLYTGEIVLTNG